MAHHTRGQGAVGFANAGTGVGHGAGGQPMLLQPGQGFDAGVVQAHTGVVEDAEQGPRGQRITCLLYTSRCV